MAVREFLNRSASLDEIDKFVGGLPDGPRVLCIVGSPGSGKSELLRQFFGRRRRPWPLVSVDRSELGDGSPPPPVWALLSQAMDRQATLDGFPARLTAWSERKRKARSVGGVLVAAAAKAFKPLAIIKEVGDRAGEISEAFATPEPDKVYVRQAAAAVPCAIHVDHAEGCAEEDWRFLSMLLATTQCLLLVEGGAGFSPPTSLLAWDAVRVRLAPLEDAFASVLFESLPAGLGQDLRACFDSSGDLRPYAEAARRSSLTGPRSPGPPAAVGDSLRLYSGRAVSALDADDLATLVALSAHLGGAVTLGLLRRFLATGNAGPTPTTDLVASLRRLEDAVLVVSTLEGHLVPHSVLEVVLGEARTRNARLLQIKGWRDFYFDPRRCGLPLADRQRCLQVLRQCVPLRDAVGISSTLEAVGAASPGADVRTDMATFARWLAGQFDLEATPVVAEACARYLYGAGWFEAARDVLLAAGQPRGRRMRYFLAELYSTAGPLDRGLRLVEHERALLGATPDPDAELCLELVELHGLRNADRFGDARRQFREALHVQRFKTCRAYPVLLRSADFCLMLDEDLAECCLLLEDAARRSAEAGDRQEAASTYLALCQQYGYHDLDKARDNLARASEIARTDWVEMSAILANEAVLDIYRGEATPQTRERLEDALVLTTDPGDEVLIRLSLLIHEMLGGEASGRGIPELERLLREAVWDSEITRIVHYNLERACSALGRQAEAARHATAWRGITSSIDKAFWEYRRSGRRDPSLPSWRLDLPYYPVLLSHWKLGAIPFDAVADHG